MRLPVSIHRYYIVCEGVVFTGQGRYSVVNDTKRLAIVDNIIDARAEVKKSKYPYLSENKLRKLNRNDINKKFAYFYAQTVAIWEGREYKGAFPIGDIPITRGLCSVGIFLMRRDAKGHIIRMGRYATGLSEKAKRMHAIRKRRYLATMRREQALKKKSKPKMIRASRIKRSPSRSNTKVGKFLREVERDGKLARQFTASDLHTPIGG